MLLRHSSREKLCVGTHQDQQALLRWRGDRKRRQRAEQHDVDAARDQVDLQAADPASDRKRPQWCRGECNLNSPATDGKSEMDTVTTNITACASKLRTDL